MEDIPNNPGVDASEAHDLVAQVLRGAQADSSIETDIEIPGIDLIHRIGRGGMGEVYFASVQSSGEEVAVKVLNPATGSDPLSAERFIREGETLDRLNHPNLLTIRGRGTLADGRPYLITEYAEGGTLADVLSKRDLLDDDSTIKYTGQLCSGLAEVHAAGLVHRDIKPSNLLLGGAGHLIVADFGLAKELQLEQTELTLSGTALGTASYMAPEQGIPGETVDARADIFAVGVVLYKMLTGELPKGQFKPPSSFKRNREWDRIIARCLATSPAERYSNAAELGSEIDKLNIRPPGRRKLIVAGLGAGAVIVAGGYVALSNRGDGWVDLLPKFQVDSPWSRDENGHLVCGTILKSLTAFADFDAGDSYELRLTWRRLEGEASLAVFIPTAQGDASFEMGAWQRDVAGIQSINGMTTRSRGSHSMNYEFINNVDYNIYLKVSPEAIVYSISNSDPSIVNIAGKTLEIGELWENMPQNRIGIGAWRCRARFSKLDYKPL